MERPYPKRAVAKGQGLKRAKAADTDPRPLPHRPRRARRRFKQGDRPARQTDSGARTAGVHGKV